MFLLRFDERHSFDWNRANDRSMTSNEASEYLASGRMSPFSFFKAFVGVAVIRSIGTDENETFSA